MFIISGILVSSAFLALLLYLTTKKIDPLRDFWRVAAAVILTDLGGVLVYLICIVSVFEMIGVFGMFLASLLACSFSHYYILGWLFDLNSKQRMLITGLFMFSQFLWFLITGLMST